MAKAIYCPFYSKADSTTCWEFSGPRGTGLQNKGGKWNWADKSTPTSKTGPSTGHTHGYVYMETGSPTRTGSVFTMTSIDSFEANLSEITVSYYYNMNTDAPVQVEVLAWDGFKWNIEDTFTPEEHELGDEWLQRSFTVENYNNDDCKIRFKITILNNGGKSYRKDFALDSIEVKASDGDIDTIVNFFAPKDIHKRKKFGKEFSGKHKTKQEFDTSIEDFKANIGTFDFSKYPDGIVIIESDNIIHHFKEEDKWH